MLIVIYERGGLVNHNSDEDCACISTAVGLLLFKLGGLKEEGVVQQAL